MDLQKVPSRQVKSQEKLAELLDKLYGPGNYHVTVRQPPARDLSVVVLPSATAGESMLIQVTDRTRLLHHQIPELHERLNLGESPVHLPVVGGESTSFGF